MKTIYSSISKRVFSLLVALIMAISTVPFAAASAFAQEQGISITTSTITPNTKSVEVTLAQDITTGFAKVIQLDSEEAERLRGLEATYQYSTLNEMQAKLDLVEKQCEYWQKQATNAQSQLKEAAQNATKWHEAYNELQQSIDKQVEQGRLIAARQDASELKQLEEQLRKEADNKIAEAAAIADQKIREAQKQLSIAAQRQKNATQRLQDAQAIEISYELASAQNVYRIMRERANAARGIVPKKSHDGYLVLSSRQWIDRYPAVIGGKKMQCSAAVWKSVLETPYDVALPADQIAQQVENDLRKVISDIGCHCMVSEKDNGRYKSGMEKIENSREKNVLYKWDLVANFKSGFWSLEIYTTKGLKVPESRRPVQKQPRKK